MTSRTKKVILAAVSLLAVFLIVFHFTDTPSPWVDEGLFTETAKNLAMHGVLGVQTSPGQFFPMNNFLLSVSYPVIFPIAGTFLLFGTGIWQARLVMIIYMMLLVLAFYVFTKRRYGFNAAIMSVLFLLSFSPFYGNGRPVQGEVPGLFWMVFGSWLLLKWQESDYKLKYGFLAGLSLGLGASIKPVFLIGIPVSLGIALVLQFKKSDKWKKIGPLILGFAGPVLLWMYIHLPTLNDVKMFIPNILYFSGDHDKNRGALEAMLVNAKRFFTESTPVLFLFMFAIIFVSLILVIYKHRKKFLDRFSLAEMFLFVFILFNWFGYLKGTGWYRYFFPANVLLYLFLPQAVFYILEHLKPLWKRLAFAGMVLLMVFQFAHLIFYSDTNFMIYRDRTSELSSFLSDVKPNQSVMFYAAVEAPIFLHGDNYTQFLGMGNFLDTGNREIIKNPSADFLVIRGHDFEFPCYKKRAGNRYDFFTRVTDCKK